MLEVSIADERLPGRPLADQRPIGPPDDVGRYPSAEAALEAMADAYEADGEQPHVRVSAQLTIRYRLNGFKWTDKLTGYIRRTENGRLVVKARAGVTCGWPIIPSNVGRIDYASQRMRDLHGPLFVRTANPSHG